MRTSIWPSRYDGKDVYAVQTDNIGNKINLGHR
jgi:hypothetical protein